MSPLKSFWAGVIYYSGLGGLIKALIKQPSCVVLVYHRVCPLKQQNPALARLFTDSALFEAQMKYLKKNFQVITLEDLICSLTSDKAIPPNSVVITFDDGYADNYEFAYPILKRLSLPATIFVPSAFVETGRSFWWDRLQDEVLLKQSEVLKLSSLLQEEQILNDLKGKGGLKDQSTLPSIVSWDQLREMQAHGIGVGGHTHTHRAMAVIKDENVEQELHLSRDILKDKLGQMTNVLAYPYGEDRHVGGCATLAKEAGYQAGFTCESGLVTKNGDRYLLPRIMIGGNEPMALFKLKASGAFHYLLQIRKLCR